VFPGFLPSTFKSKQDREAAFERDMKLRLGIAELMQDAVAKIAKKQLVPSGTAAADGNTDGAAPVSREASQLLELLSEVRHGRRVSASDMANLSKLFRDVITIDQMSRKQLVRLSTFFGLVPYASDNILRYQLRKKIRSLRYDDKVKQQSHSDWLGNAAAYLSLLHSHPSLSLNVVSCAVMIFTCSYCRTSFPPSPRASCARRVTSAAFAASA
jgi:LETM1 and EF-hand domain-containing protein 1